MSVASSRAGWPGLDGPGFSSSGHRGMVFRAGQRKWGRAVTSVQAVMKAAAKAMCSNAAAISASRLQPCGVHGV